MLLRRDVERLHSDSRLTKGERHAEPVVPAEPLVAVGLVRVVGQQVLVLERDARLVVLDLLAPLGGRAEREVLDGAPRDGEGDEPRAGRRRARRDARRPEQHAPCAASHPAGMSGRRGASRSLGEAVVR